VNPHAVGASATALTNIDLGQARTTLSTEPTRSTAAAGSMDAGTARAAGATAYQQAPPSTLGGSHAIAGASDLGAARFGANHLLATARWNDGYRCGAFLGEASSSSATLAGAALLPGSGGQTLLRIPDDAASGTTTGLLKHNGHAAAGAGASLRLNQLRLFEGTGAEATVRILAQPSLNALATGEKATSSVRYAAPVLEVATPDGARHRLANPGAYLDLPVPASMWSGLPRGTAAVLRLSIGTVTSRITGSQVHASATPLRVQVKLAPGHAVALPRAGAATVLDLSVGELDVSADAARAATGSGGYGSGSGSDTPSATPTPSTTVSSSLGSGSGGSGSGSGTLPVTGPSLGWIAAGGIALAGVGYALMLLARKRLS
jgi:hypothetical protein